MSKGLPNVVVRFILDGYIRQSARIQWEGVKSRSFNTFNGVNHFSAKFLAGLLALNTDFPGYFK